jgi:predicted dithiol-disulfide oxidoreductase (DUF899 family)
MRQTRLEESPQYVAARDELRLAEIALMRQREEVAALRRALPPGPVVEDYVFEEGPVDLDVGDEPVREVRLSELVGASGRSLVVYHLMYGKKQTEPCPMCTLWVDGFNGIAHHLDQRVDFVVAAAADLPALRSHGRRRGWDGVRLLGCGDSTFKYDLGSEDEDGNQDSTVSVFTRGGDGAIHHTYSSHPHMDLDIQERGIDLLSPLWNVLDLTPEGRGDFYSALEYPPPARD